MLLQKYEAHFCPKAETDLSFQTLPSNKTEEIYNNNTNNSRESKASSVLTTST